MARPRHESDERWNDARRKIKPHFKLHHSIQNHPRTTEVYADNDLFAAYNRLGLLASERGAAHTGNRVTLSRADVERTSGKRRADVASTLLERLAHLLGWWTERRGDVLVIEFRNFARKQGIATRDSRNGDAEYAVLRGAPLSPLPTPHTAEDLDRTVPLPSVRPMPGGKANGTDAPIQPPLSDEEAARVKPIVEDIIAVTGDSTPRSVPYWIYLARELDEQTLRREISDLKQAKIAGTVRNPAALFNDKCTKLIERQNARRSAAHA